MKITRDVLGWRIIPSTNNEEDHLEFLFNALQEEYGKCFEIGDDLPLAYDHADSGAIPNDLLATDKFPSAQDHTNPVLAK